MIRLSDHRLLSVVRHIGDGLACYLCNSHVGGSRRHWRITLRPRIALALVNYGLGGGAKDLVSLTSHGV
jgi:hypothetical protein